MKWFLAAAFFFVVLISWSLTTPVGGYPDDSFHFANIWCDEGINGMSCAYSEDGSRRSVPNVFTEGSPWWGTTGYGEVLADPKGTYPGLYYSAMRQIISDNVVRSVYVMRVFNCLIAVAMLSLALYVSRTAVRVPLIASWTLMGPSLLFYYVSSSHPISWSITGVCTGWAFVASAISSIDRKQLGLSVLGLFCALFLTLGSRPEGQLLAGAFVVFGALVGSTELLRNSRRPIPARAKVLFGGGIAALIAAISGGLFLRGTGVTRALANEVFVVAGGGIWTKFVETPLLYLQIFGSNARVTEDPTLGIQFPVSSVLFGAVILLAFSQMNWQRMTTVCFTTLLAFVAPYVSIVDDRGVLFTPPRYLVALLTLFIASLFVGENVKSSNIANQWRVIWILVFIVHSLALSGALKPFILGGGREWSPNLNNGLKWWWQVGPSPMTVWLIGVLSFGAVVYLVGPKILNSSNYENE